MARKNNGILSFLFGFLFVVLAFGVLSSLFTRLDTCEHEWGDGVVKTEATCTSAGRIEYECELCGETKTTKVLAKGHTLVKVPEIAATCKMPGETEGEKCTVCGTYTIPTQIIPPAHKSVIDEAVAATCLKSGLTAGEHCSACGEIILAQTEVAALGHSDGDGDGVCERCQLPLNFADFIANNTFTKETVAAGELAVGNVYRVYYDYIPARAEDQPEGYLSPQVLKFSNGTQIHNSHPGNSGGQIMSSAVGDAGVNYPAEYCVAGEDTLGRYYDYLIVEGLTFSVLVSYDPVESATFTFTADMTVAAFDEGVYRLEVTENEQESDYDFSFVEEGNYTLEAVEIGEEVVGNVYRVYCNYLPDRAPDMPDNTSNGKDLLFSNGVRINASYEIGIITDLGVTVDSFGSHQCFISGSDDNGSFVDFYITEGLTLSLLASINGDGDTSVGAPVEKDFVFSEGVTIQSFSDVGVYRLAPTTA